MNGSTPDIPRSDQHLVDLHLADLHGACAEKDWRTALAIAGRIDRTLRQQAEAGGLVESPERTAFEHACRTLLPSLSERRADLAALLGQFGRDAIARRSYRDGSLP